MTRVNPGTTDERGEYRLHGVTPGRFKVQAELAGFTTALIPQVELLVGQNATVPFTLKLASVTETLTVTRVVSTLITSMSEATTSKYGSSQ